MPHLPEAKNIFVVIPEIDPVSENKVQAKHYAGLDEDRVACPRFYVHPNAGHRTWSNSQAHWGVHEDKDHLFSNYCDLMKYWHICDPLF